MSHPKSDTVNPLDFLHVGLKTLQESLQQVFQTFQKISYIQEMQETGAIQIKFLTYAHLLNLIDTSKM